MLTEFVEIRDFFDDPYEIVMLAKQQTFVERNAHYHNADRQTFFNGVRSKTLIDIDKNMYDKVYAQLFKKLIDHRFKDDITRIRVDYNFKSHAYFHVMREQDKFGDGWMHKDDKSILAGVIYLNPNPRPNTGTIVHRYGDDKEPVIVENEFNKMVMYDTSFLHAPQAGFGTDINDSRLTLVFFIGELSFRVGMAAQMDQQDCGENEVKD